MQTYLKFIVQLFFFSFIIKLTLVLTFYKLSGVKMILNLKNLYFLFSFTFYLLVSCFYLMAETRTTIYEKDHWKVFAYKYDDGGRACIASVSNSEMELQIYRSKDFYELATFYEDFTNKKYDFFKFQIDNNDPWIDDSPEYDNGWLMSNISNYTEQAASEIEREMRAGRKFYHLDKNDTIAWFSLIGSNKAFDAFDKCVLKNGLY